MSAVDDMVKFFVTAKKLNPSNGTASIGWVDRQRMYFLRSRAEEMLAQTPPLAAADVKTRLGAEFDAVEAYLKAQVGSFAKPGALLPVLGGNASLDKTPHALDLADLAYRRSAEAPKGKTVTSRARQLSIARWVRVRGIAWRAAALVDSIWTNAPDSTHLTATLAPGILDELVDRRLRTVERMQYQVSDTTGEADDDALGAGGLGLRKSVGDWGSGVRGPWKDGFRIRPFEYPRINGGTSTLQKTVDPHGAGYIADPSTAALLPHSHDDPSDVALTPASDHRHWGWHNDNKTRLAWRVVHGTVDLKKPAPAEWRFPAALQDDYRANPDDQYRIDVVPTSRSGSDAIDALFDHTRPGPVAGAAAVTDMWERSWLWCDHVIAAIHAEALLSGLRRRFGVATGEGRFNDLVAGRNLPANALVPYVRLRPPIGILDASHEPWLLTDPQSRHFESGLTSVDSLEIGDHVVFWNSFLYTVLARGDWRLENSLVIGLDLDPATGATKPSTIRLQGHGTPVRFYGGFQGLIADKMEDGLGNAQRLVKTKVADVSPASRPTDLPFQSTKLVQWTPYSPLTRVAWGGGVLNLAPWWIVVDPRVTPLAKGTLTDAQYARAVAEFMPKASADRPSPGAGYTPPPVSNMILFPLFEPRFAVTAKSASGGKPTKLSGWAAYFAWHEAKATLDKPPAKVPTLMDVMRMSGDLVPGLFLRPDRLFPAVWAIPSQ